MSVTLMLEYGDWVLRPDGVFDIVTGYRKGVQDIAESLQNNYDPEDPSWFNGSTLYEIDKNPMIVAEQGLGAEVLIRTSVEDSILRLMDLQNEDNYVEDDELITEIRNLMVRRIGASSFFFQLVCINNSDQEITERFKLKLLPRLPSGLDESLTGGLELNRDKKTFL